MGYLLGTLPTSLVARDGHTESGKAKWKARPSRGKPSTKSFTPGLQFAHATIDFPFASSGGKFNEISCDFNL